MAELRVKIGPKGQILIPKIFRDRYGLKRGGTAIIELSESGILVRGRPSVEEVERNIERHVAQLQSQGIRGSKLGEMKGLYLEMEFEKTGAKAVPRR